MDWLQYLPTDFVMGVLAGLTIGIFSRYAVRFLAAAVVVVAIVKLLIAAGAL